MHIVKAQEILKHDRSTSAEELQTLLGCSLSYAYELRRIILSKGRPEPRGPIVRACMEKTGFRPEEIIAAYPRRTNAALADLLMTVIDVPITHQYVRGIRKAKQTMTIARARIIHAKIKQLTDNVELLPSVG